MNTFTKLTALALTAASIAGGVAVAQDTSSANTKDKYTNSDTANYGTPPGAALKRDGSLRASDAKQLQRLLAIIGHSIPLLYQSLEQCVRRIFVDSIRIFVHLASGRSFNCSRAATGIKSVCACLSTAN